MCREQQGATGSCRQGSCDRGSRLWLAPSPVRIKPSCPYQAISHPLSVDIVPRAPTQGRCCGAHGGPGGFLAQGHGSTGPSPLHCSVGERVSAPILSSKVTSNSRGAQFYFSPDTSTSSLLHFQSVDRQEVKKASEPCERCSSVTSPSICLLFVCDRLFGGL